MFSLYMNVNVAKPKQGEKFDFHTSVGSNGASALRDIEEQAEQHPGDEIWLEVVLMEDGEIFYGRGVEPVTSFVRVR